MLVNAFLFYQVASGKSSDQGQQGLKEHLHLNKY